MTRIGKVLYVIVCAAGPAPDVGRLVALAQEGGWVVQVRRHSVGRRLHRRPGVGGADRASVRSRYRKPHEPKSPRADAIIVAPASYNTINKFAQGVADTYALGLLSEAPGLGIPVVVLPFVNTALAGRIPFRRSVDQLRAEGVRVLLGPGEFEPHPPSSGPERIDGYPWALALECVTRPQGQSPEERFGD